jgi:hypothetical protein
MDRQIASAIIERMHCAGTFLCMTGKVGCSQNSLLLLLLLLLLRGLP